MLLTEKGNQCEKLFQHLNYCILVLKKSLDQPRLDIIKRVQHDIQLLQKYIKSILKYIDKRENDFENIMNDLKNKNAFLDTQNNQIDQLTCQISKQKLQITRKSLIIQHLKQSKKIDASYVSSILFNQNSGNGQKILTKSGKILNHGSDIRNKDLLNLSQYSEHCEQQETETKQTRSSSKSDVKAKSLASENVREGIMDQEKQGPFQKGYSVFKDSKDNHKGSNLIFTE